jgi:hypothetical protein
MMKFKITDSPRRAAETGMTATSESGTKRTCRGHPAMSALGGKADMTDL